MGPRTLAIKSAVVPCLGLLGCHENKENKAIWNEPNMRANAIIPTRIKVAIINKACLVIVHQVPT